MLDELVSLLLRRTSGQPGAAFVSTPHGEIGILRSDHPKPPAHLLSRPSLCLVARGAKWASFGGRQLLYRAGEALVVGVASPSKGRVIEADPAAPCLVLALELDLALLREVAGGLRPPPPAAGGAGAFVIPVTGPLLDCAVRLVRLLDRPEALPTLYPLLLREISYWLLTGPQGAAVHRLALADAPSARVAAAIHHLRERFAEAVRIEELAAVARLSASAFHRHFKAVTALTPLQYQKQIRLLEARRLLIAEAYTVEAAAFAVGYESPSQFSREYSRLFGAPPKRDTRGAISPAG